MAAEPRPWQKMSCAPAELDDVPHDQEVAGEAELLDHVELVVDLRVRAGHPLVLPRPVAARPRPSQVSSRSQRHLGVARRAPGSRAGWGATRREVEGAGAGRARRPARPRPGSGRSGGPARRRERRWAAAAAGQPAVDLVEAAPGPHRGQRGGQPAARRRGVVHVVGGDHVDARRAGQLGQGVVAGRVERVAVVPQLDGHVVAPEGVDQPVAARARPPPGPSSTQRAPAPRPCGSR